MQSAASAQSDALMRVSIHVNTSNWPVHISPLQQQQNTCACAMASMLGQMQAILLL
jgi:ABC-type histidine transport system ATPase subunit